jgi:hypothetical protein
MLRFPLLAATAAVLAAFSGPAAHAQSSGDRSSGWMEMDDQDSGHWTRGDDGNRDEQSWQGHHRRWDSAGRDGGGDRDEGARHGRPEEGSMSRFGGGARFMLRSGDVRLAVQCGRGETMRDCVEATILLMDKARGSGRGQAGGSDTAPSSPNPPATSPQQP